MPTRRQVLARATCLRAAMLAWLTTFAPWHVLRGRYREGSDFARQAIIESPNLAPAYRSLVVNCALGGELQEAVEVLGELKKRFLPHLTLKWIDDELPYVRADERQRYLQGFRLAGLE